MADVIPLVPKGSVCRACGGPPDMLYVKGDTAEVVSILCRPCHERALVVLKFAGALCNDPECEQCKRGLTQWT